MYTIVTRSMICTRDESVYYVLTHDSSFLDDLPLVDILHIELIVNKLSILYVVILLSLVTSIYHSIFTGGSFFVLESLLYHTLPNSMIKSPPSTPSIFEE